MIKTTILNFKPLQKKSVYLTATFFLTPVITYLVMSGLFSEYIYLFLAVTAVFFIILVSVCVNDRKNIKGAITAVFILSAAFMSAYVSYNAGYTGAVKLLDYTGNKAHSFCGYIAKEDAGTSSYMFVELTSVDGKPVKPSVTAQAFNHTGYYLENGAYVEFEAKLKSVEEKDGENNSWLKSKGVYAVLSGMKDFVPVSEKDKLYIAGKIKDFFSRRMLTITSYILNNDRFQKTFSISNAMMFGDKSGLDKELKMQFSRSGIIHILCVSGLHFSVMLAGLSFILKYTVINRKARYFIITGASFFYLFLCGFTGSALRAAVMSLIGSACITGARKNICTYILLLAVCVICIVNPHSVFDNGFMMSCVCCIGILCSSLLSEQLGKRFRFHPVVSVLLSSVLVSFSASSFLFPYSLAAFNGASTVSVAASTLAVMPAQLFLTVCFIASIVSLADIGICNFIFSSLLSRLCGFICKVAEFFSGLRYSYIECEMPDISFFVFMFILGGAALVAFTKHRAVSVYLYTVSASVLFTVAVFIVNAI